MVPSGRGGKGMARILSLDPRVSPRATQSVGLDGQTSVRGAVPGIFKILAQAHSIT